jgi:hypothetical protein
MPTPSHGSPGAQPTRLFYALACLATAAAGLGAALQARANPTTVNASGAVDFIQEYEYGTAGPLPPGAVPLLPLFSGATRVLTSFSFDPTVPVDLDPNPQAGQYVTPGSFTLALPDIGLSFTASGQIGFSVYTAGEFHVNGNVTGYSGNVGTATPFAISFVFYTPVANDGLPSSPGAWTYGNAYVDFKDVEPYRDIFIGVAPVPEPPGSVLLLSALAAGFVLRRAAGFKRRPGTSPGRSLRPASPSCRRT